MLYHPALAVIVRVDFIRGKAVRFTFVDVILNLDTAATPLS